MRQIDLLLGRVVTGLAVLAAVWIAVVTIAIVYDVTVRNLGGQPPIWTTPLAELGMHWITLLAAPWVMRQKGHILIATAVEAFPKPVQWVVDRAVCVVCMVLSFLFCWYSITIGIEKVEQDRMRSLAIDIPEVWFFVPLALALFLIGIEFLRLLLLRDALFEGTSKESV